MNFVKTYFELTISHCAPLFLLCGKIPMLTNFLGFYPF